jgi:hypothetical protein
MGSDFVLICGMRLELADLVAALGECRGDVTECAARLDVDSQHLRSIVRRTPELAAECEEAKEQLVDAAEAVVAGALKSSDARLKDTAARFVIEKLGQDRRLSRSNVIQLRTPGGTIEIGWAETDAEQEV